MSSIFTFQISFTAFLLILSLNIARAEPAQVRVYGVDFTPLLSIERGYTDNLLYQPNNELDTWYTIITPRLLGELRYGIFSSDFSLSHSSGFYEESSDDNYSDNQVLLNLRWQPNHRNHIAVTTEIVDGHEERGRGISSGGGISDTEEPNTFLERSLNGLYRYGSDSARGKLEFEAGYSERDYTNNRQQTRESDYENTDLRSTFFGRIGGNTYYLVEADIEEINYTADTTESRDVNRKALLTGLTWGITGKSISYAKVGYQKTTTDGSEDNKRDGITWDVIILWAPKKYSEFSVLTSRSVLGSTGDENYSDNRNLDLAWSIAFSQRFETALMYGRNDVRYVGSSENRKDKADIVTLDLRYNMRRWLHFGLKTSNNTNRSNINIYDFERNDISLYIDLSL